MTIGDAGMVAANKTAAVNFYTIVLTASKITAC